MNTNNDRNNSRASLASQQEHAGDENDDTDYSSSLWMEESDGMSSADGMIVRQIASFLTLSDAASLASTIETASRPVRRQGSSSMGHSASAQTIGPVESWASFISAVTPETPGLMALSPDEHEDYDNDDGVDGDNENGISGRNAGHQQEQNDQQNAQGSHDNESVRQRLQDRQRKWVKQKLAAAVFAHPQSLRSYCLEAHRAATQIQETKLNQLRSEIDPETLREPEQHDLFRRLRDCPSILFDMLMDTLFRNVPLVLCVDVVGAAHETVLDTSFAGLTLGLRGLNGLVQAVLSFMQEIWHRITTFDPLAVVDAILSLEFNAASEALVSGIQSVATGVGSAALQRLSRGGGDPPLSSTSVDVLMRNNDIFNKKVCWVCDWQWSRGTSGTDKAQREHCLIVTHPLSISLSLYPFSLLSSVCFMVRYRYDNSSSRS